MVDVIFGCGFVVVDLWVWVFCDGVVVAVIFGCGLPVAL